MAASDMGLYEAAVMAVDFSTTGVGGAISAVAVMTSSVGGVFFTMAAEAAGGANKLQHEKVFGKNTHGSLAMSGVKWWLDNGLDDWPATDFASLVLATADATKKARFIGFLAGTAIQSEVALSGLTNTSPDQFTAGFMDRVEIRNVASPSALVAIHETGTVKQGATEVGFVPGPIAAISVPGRWSANAEVDMGLATAINDAGTTAAPTTATQAPAGVSFTRPRKEATQELTVAGGLSVPGGGGLAAGDRIGIWLRLTLKPGGLTSSNVQHVLGFRIQAAA